MPAIAVTALAGTIAAFYVFAQAEPPPRYRFAKVDRGPIVSAVSATGTINPVVTVLVGTQLSGQIKELLADFNTPVQTGQVVARLDSEQTVARMAQARADLQSAQAALIMQRAQADRARADLENARANVANNRAQIVRAEALLKDAERDHQRKRELLGRGAATAADTERAETAVDASKAQLVANQALLESAIAALAAAKASVEVSLAQIASSEAQVAQREAAIQQVQVDLNNSEIRSPIDGVVIQRSVDVGQTVASSFQAPELFKIAQDLRRIEVWASVDEGDIGRVAPGQEVTFTVNAYPGTTFRGEVLQVRLGPQTIQNVVTYTVVIAADNAELRLLPGMTATVRIIAERRGDVLRVPNAALRYRPPGMPGQANDAPASGSPPRGGPGAGEEFARTLVRELNLNAEQQRHLTEIMAESRREFQAMRSAGLTPDQLRSRGQAIRQTTADRINAILTAEQQPKFAALRAAQSAGVTSSSLAGRVWILGGDGQPQAVAVRLGIGDGSSTEIIGGDLMPGQDVIVGGGAARSVSTASFPRLGL